MPPSLVDRGLRTRHARGQPTDSNLVRPPAQIAGSARRAHLTRSAHSALLEVSQSADDEVVVAERQERSDDHAARNGSAPTGASRPKRGCDDGGEQRREQVGNDQRQCPCNEGSSDRAADASNPRLGLLRRHDSMMAARPGARKRHLPDGPFESSGRDSGRIDGAACFYPEPAAPLSPGGDEPAREVRA